MQLQLVRWTCCHMCNIALWGHPFSTYALMQEGVLLQRIGGLLTLYVGLRITCSAVAILQSVIGGLASPRRHFNTSRRRNSKSYSDKTVHVWYEHTCPSWHRYPPARGRSTHAWNIHALWHSFLVACLFVDRETFTHDAKKYAVRPKLSALPVSAFSISPFSGSFLVTLLRRCLSVADNWWRSSFKNLPYILSEAKWRIQDF